MEVEIKTDNPIFILIIKIIRNNGLSDPQKITLIRETLKRSNVKKIMK